MSSHEAIRNAVEATTQAVIRESQVVYHGLLAAVAATRGENASQNAERMEHKIELYDTLGTLALTGAKPETDIKPRTLAEKFVDWRMHRKSIKKIHADNKAFRDHRTFGPDSKALGTSVRQAAVDRVLSIPFDRETEEGVLSSITHNTRAVFEGPGIDGTSPLKKMKDRAENNIGFLTGKKRASDRHKTSLKIQSTSPKLGSKSYRKTRRDKRRADERLNLTVEMPITSRWRSRRLRKAEERTERMEERRLRHREAIRRLRGNESMDTNEQPTVELGALPQNTEYNPEINSETPTTEPEPDASIPPQEETSEANVHNPESTLTSYADSTEESNIDAEIASISEQTGISPEEVKQHISAIQEIEALGLNHLLESDAKDLQNALKALGFTLSNGNRNGRLIAVKHIVGLQQALVHLAQTSSANKSLIRRFIKNDLGYKSGTETLEEYLTAAVDYSETDPDEED